MTEKNHNESLSERVRYMVMQFWDPIGISQFSEASDEYDLYIPDLCQMLIHKCNPDEIFAYLWWLETVHIGLEGDRSATLAFANQLTDVLCGDLYKSHI